MKRRKLSLRNEDRVLYDQLIRLFGVALAQRLLLGMACQWQPEARQ